MLVDADGGGGRSDSEDYDWVDDEDEEKKEDDRRAPPPPPPPPPEDSDALDAHDDVTDDSSVEPRPPPTPKGGLQQHRGTDADSQRLSVLRERSATAAAAAAIPFHSEPTTSRDDYPSSSASNATKRSQGDGDDGDGDDADAAAEFAQLLDRAARLEQETQAVEARTAASARQHQVRVSPGLIVAPVCL